MTKENIAVNSLIKAIPTSLTFFSILYASVEKNRNQKMNLEKS
jgi:hypothetical protein